MEKEVIQLGSSLAVILPKKLARQAGLGKGDRVRITGIGRKIQINRLSKTQPLDLRGLIPSRGIATGDFRRHRKALHNQWVKKWKRF